VIVDAHAHIFAEIRGLNAAGPVRGLDCGRVQIGDNTIQLRPPTSGKTVHTIEMLLTHMDRVGVDKAVLLQGPFYGECNSYVLEAVRRHPDRFVAAACIDPWDPRSRDNFETTIATQNFRAVKLECSEATGYCGIHPSAQLNAPNIAWLWKELEARQSVLVLDLGSIGSRSYQTRNVRAIAEQHPKLKLVIAHLSQPDPGINDPKRWVLWEEQIDLGRLPNVWFDTAALPAYVPHEDFPFPTAGKFIRIAIERIGARKIMWGSDIPGLLSRATYRQLLNAARLHTQFLQPAEQALILGKNAAGIFGLSENS